MSEPAPVGGRVGDVVQALSRISRRFEGIESPEDFARSDDAIDRLGAICMMLIAVGEAIKSVDRATGGALPERYPEVDWKGVKGVRDVIAHGYFDLDAEQIFDICRHNIPLLTTTVSRMIADLTSA